MLEGLMQNDFPLNVNHLLRRARTVHAQTAEVVTLLSEDGEVSRRSFGEICDRVDRLGRVLERLGVEHGERVATFAWNSTRHFEVYLAVPCFGAVLHTINIRLFADQVRYIVGHAANRVLFVDDSLVPVLAELAREGFGGVEHVVVMGDADAEFDASGLPGEVHRYEQLLEEAGEGPYAFRDQAEPTAAALCYTSGTTGNPKGVLYSHRSVALHATASCMVDCNGMSSRDRALCIVPMFHVNAWGIPFAAALTGATLLMPSRFLQAQPLLRFIEREPPTLMAGVPTVLGDILKTAEATGASLPAGMRGLCGGSAVPRALMEGYEKRHGVKILQAWGMTETSPICTVAHPATPAEEDEERHWFERTSQGRTVGWVEMRLMRDDDTEAPWDGESTGEIEVRGPWIASRYYEDPSGDDKFHDGWLRTGDIGVLTPDGSVRITDRAKDLIKSGGEWISSVELEVELMAHEDVAEAAVIAMPDERWSERPLACVVLREGASPDVESLRSHLARRMAKFQVPDAFAFIDEVPKTSVGKFDKKVLRGRLAEGELDVARAGAAGAST